VRHESQGHIPARLAGDPVSLAEWRQGRLEQAALNGGVVKLTGPRSIATPGQAPFHPNRVELDVDEAAVAAELLPTVDGFVHGLVQVDPVFVVQCDGCGRVAVGELDPRGKRTALVILSCGIIFGHAADDDRRMCARCRVEAGWVDYDTRECIADRRRLEAYERHMVERDAPLF
jgi:hypothetical protein